jgi:hypothetical protein
MHRRHSTPLPTNSSRAAALAPQFQALPGRYRNDRVAAVGLFVDDASAEPEQAFADAESCQQLRRG